MGGVGEREGEGFDNHRTDNTAQHSTMFKRLNKYHFIHRPTCKCREVM